MRIGLGTDYHQLVEGRPLYIGGVLIPFHKGALGHSDADVLLHAICDALLGALCLGDIGKHFPNNDPRYKDIASIKLLEHVFVLIQQEGYQIVNIDSMLSLEAPKIGGYISSMQEKIATVLHITPKDISIKATTTETMGFVGRGEGLMAQAVVLLMPQRM